MKKWVILCLVLLELPVFGAKDSTLRYENAIYEGDIRAIRLFQSESGFNFPVIYQENSIGELTLEFDQLSSERDYYQFTLVHCDANWKPSGIPKAMYLEGTGFDNLDNVRFSNGTLTQYVHYVGTVPTEQTKPKFAGNYLLVVYRNYDESDIVLSRRIMVVSVKGNVGVQLNMSNQVEFRQTDQQVNFTFTPQKDYFIPNPYQDLKAVILRNGEWMGSIQNVKPQYIQNGVYSYNQLLGTQFKGLNEFRYFDIRSLRSAAAGVKKRLNIGNQKHVWLITDLSRQYDKYFNWKDYNGRVYYNNRDIMKDTAGAGNIGNVSLNDIESDYCFVHFTLSTDPIDEDIYVYGEMSDWRINEDCKMFYNSESKCYEAVIPLKQGYYNFMYGVKRKDAIGRNYLDFTTFEGSHSATENNYMVLIYHKNQQMGYDELVGYGLANTQGQKK